MSDIVERLRKTAAAPGTLAPRVDKRLLAEAADIIEELRGQQELDDIHTSGCLKEIDELRTGLRWFCKNYSQIIMFHDEPAVMRYVDHLKTLAGGE